MTIQDFDFNADILRALLWQYNDAENLQALLQNKQDWNNEQNQDFWNNWYRDVFNLDTANDFGLAVWSIILNVSFAIPRDQRTDDAFWGFSSTRRNFGRGNFNYNADDEIILTTEQKRTVLKLRFLRLVTKGTIPEINTSLTTLFGFNVYAVDNYDMTSTIVLMAEPTREITFILDNYDILPRPAGVKFNRRVLTGREFGFGSNRNNFRNNAYFGRNL